MRFDTFPLWLREGPWTWAATIYVPVACALVMALTPWALATVPPIPDTRLSAGMDTTTAWISCACIGWAALIVGYMFATVGSWPIVSFTIISWLIMTSRLVGVVLGPYSVGMHMLAEALRGPALFNAVIVFGVWWMVLVPLLTAFMPDHKKRMDFFKFNFSFFLVNVHALNLPLGLWSHYSTHRPLCLFDLWTALTLGMLYLMFYLMYLDPNGLHLYIILSPRTRFCVVSYTALISIHVGMYLAFGGTWTADVCHAFW